jgi:hypothetical protein
VPYKNRLPAFRSVVNAWCEQFSKVTLDCAEDRINTRRVVGAEFKPIAAMTNAKTMSFVKESQAAVAVICGEPRHAGPGQSPNVLSYLSPSPVERQLGKNSLFTLGDE